MFASWIVKREIRSAWAMMSQDYIDTDAVLKVVRR